MGDENSTRFPTVKNSRRHSIIGLLPDLPRMRNRKRKLDDDTVSLQSFESSKKKSRRKSLLRVSSLVNLLSPKVAKNSKGLQRTLSFKVPNAPTPPPGLSPYKVPPPSPGKLRLMRTWSDMMNTDGKLAELSLLDIKRQEAIYELYQGEIDLIEDLTVVINTYRDSMQTLQLMTDHELQQIFGPVDELLPLHEDLVNRLKTQRMPDGMTREVGLQLVDWIPNLKAYIDFCANMVFGKALLDEKKNDPAVDDFLTRCQESPFSRKLDLWGLLDGARGRFMKYPLLLRNIQKYTTRDEPDGKHLSEAIRLSEEVVGEADRRAGGAKCIYYRSRISYLYDDQHHPAIDDATSLVCNGTLKNNKGSKLQLFLFNTILVVTRRVSKNGQQFFQAYRDPIPVTDLVVDNLNDGHAKMGSFRSAFGSSQTSKNIFRVSFCDSNKGQSHTLMSNDEHDKRQWLHCFRKALEQREGTSQDD